MLVCKWRKFLWLQQIYLLGNDTVFLVRYIVVTSPVDIVKIYSVTC